MAFHSGFSIHVAVKCPMKIIILINSDSFKIIVYDLLFLKRSNFYHYPRFIFYLQLTSQFRIGNATGKLFLKPRILFPKREENR